MVTQKYGIRLSLLGLVLVLQSSFSYGAILKNWRLGRAAERGDTTNVIYLLDEGANPNSQDRHGLTALMKASLGGHFEAVKALIENRASCLIKDENNLTALNYAIKSSDSKIAVEIIKCAETRMLGNKVSIAPRVRRELINVQNISGNTPLHEALLSKNTDIADLLIKYGADISIKNNNLETPMLLAVRMGHLNSLEYGLSTLKNSRDIDSQHIYMINSLAKKKNAREIVKETLLMEASMSHSPVEVLVALLRRNPDVNIQDTVGMTALMFAANTCQAKKVDLLLRNGADRSIRNLKGESAHDLARNNGCSSAQSLLNGFKISTQQDQSAQDQSPQDEEQD